MDVNYSYFNNSGPNNYTREEFDRNFVIKNRKKLQSKKPILQDGSTIKLNTRRRTVQSPGQLVIII